MAHPMDKPLQKKALPASRWALVSAAVLVPMALAYSMLDGARTVRLTVDPTRLTAAPVHVGQFREYYPFDGTVEPVTTVYLDIEEGGRVEQIFVEGGRHVEQGELILRFSNAALQRSSIDTETRLVENLNALRNTKITLAQNALVLRSSLLDLDHEILDLEKTYARYEALVESSDVTDGGITRQAFEQTGDRLDYLRAKRGLLVQRIEREEDLSRQQLEQADRSIERLNTSLALLTRIIDNLDVRAPISGFLSSIDAQVGENIGRGERIGQIDVLDRYKIRVRIDQYYIGRVDVGTPGKFDLDGRTYPVVVQKIYPEVVDDTFFVDVSITGEVPPTLRRGQRLTVEMTFGEPSEALMVAKGGFQQGTGGRWVYLLSKDRRSAKRTAVRLGRQNPRYVEVLEGLLPGDWIVTSGYDAFNGADELELTAPLELYE